MWIVSSGQHNADEATESRGCGESLNLPRLWSCTRDTHSDQQNKQFQTCGDFEQHSFMNIRHSGDWCENFCDLFCDKSGATLGTRGGQTLEERNNHTTENWRKFVCSSLRGWLECHWELEKWELFAEDEKLESGEKKVEGQRKAGGKGNCWWLYLRNEELDRWWCW